MSGLTSSARYRLHGARYRPTGPPKTLGSIIDEAGRAHLIQVKECQSLLTWGYCQISAGGSGQNDSELGLDPPQRPVQSRLAFGEFEQAVFHKDKMLMRFLLGAFGVTLQDGFQQRAVLLGQLAA